MHPYTATNLTALSTILTCVTRTQTWQNLGTKDRSAKQEEIQILRIGERLFIACNQDGHQYVKHFLTAFGVSDDLTFAYALRVCHYLLNCTYQERKDLYHSQSDRSEYSVQEKTNISHTQVPANLAIAEEDKTLMNNCVGKKTENRDTMAWQGACFQQLLGIYQPTKKKKSNYTDSFGPPRAATFGEVGADAIPDDTTAINLCTDTAGVHAELKLLAMLTRMLAAGKLSGTTEVFLGGLKAACKECSGWIEAYSPWLSTNYSITLNLPEEDARPSANPKNWDKPTLGSDDLAALTAGDGVAELFTI